MLSLPDDDVALPSASANLPAQTGSALAVQLEKAKAGEPILAHLLVMCPDQKGALDRWRHTNLLVMCLDRKGVLTDGLTDGDI